MFWYRLNELWMRVPKLRLLLINHLEKKYADHPPTSFYKKYTRSVHLLIHQSFFTLGVVFRTVVLVKLYFAFLDEKVKFRLSILTVTPRILGTPELWQRNFDTPPLVMPWSLKYPLEHSQKQEFMFEFINENVHLWRKGLFFYPTDPGRENNSPLFTATGYSPVEKLGEQKAQAVLEVVRNKLGPQAESEIKEQWARGRTRPRGLNILDKPGEEYLRDQTGNTGIGVKL